MLNDNQRETVKKLLEPLPGEVGLMLFTSDGCGHCATQRELLEEVASLGRLSLEVLDAGSAEAKEHGVAGTPAIIFRDRPGIQFMGLTNGHEFRSLLDTILLVGSGESGLKPGVKERLAGLDKQVELLVFATPHCPYCPMASMMANRMAMENEKVRVTTVEAQEFPELSRKHSVMSVPKVVVNGADGFVGALPEEAFVEKVLSAL